MTNQEVANRLYELNRDRKNPQAYTELYAKDIVSIEKNNLTGAFEERVGLEHLMKLSENFWNSIEEIHDGYIHEPRVFDNLGQSSPREDVCRAMQLNCFPEVRVVVFDFCSSFHKWRNVNLCNRSK